MADSVERLSIAVDGKHRVSGLLQSAENLRACFVLAHGAGAGMEHPSMATVAEELEPRGIATLRYQFPYMEQRSKRPDPPALCHATVRAAVAEAARRMPGVPLIAGGRSFGGRMTSQAQALSPLPGVRGLVFLAFPLHPAKRPSDERAAHLFEISIPMLFLQGTHDALADLSLLQPLMQKLGSRATLELLQDADHSFRVPARSGRTDQEARAQAWDALTRWLGKIL
ncbi:MAG TPA: alpha/beta family hydrolase [Steroidobacteraceae bacterium]